MLQFALALFLAVNSQEFATARDAALKAAGEARHEDARRAAQEMLDSARGLKSKFWEASALAVLGLAQLRLRDPDSALISLHQAYQMHSDPAWKDDPLAIRDAGPLERAFTAGVLGAVYVQLGQPRKGLDFLNQALALATESQPVAQGRYKTDLLTLRVVIHRDLGLASFRMGQHEKAIGHLKEALEIFPQMRGAPMAMVHAVLIEVYMAKGQVDFAETHAKQFLAHALSLDHPVMVPDAYNRLGHIAMARGDEKAAEAYFEKAGKHPQNGGRGMTALGGVYERRGNAKRALEQFEKAIDVVEKGLIQPAGEKDRIRVFQQNLEPYMRSIDNTLELYFRPFGKETTYARQAFEGNQRIRNRMFDEQLAAARKTVPFGELSIEEIQAVIPKNAALLEYNVSAFPAVFVFTRDQFQVVRFPKPDEFPRRVATYFDVVSTTSGDAFKTFGTGGGYELFEEMLLPVLRILPETVSHLIISPPPPLEILPFEALPMNRAGKFLIEKYAVSYVPSASALPIIFDKRHPGSGRQLLAFADPELPFAAVEVDSVAEIVGREHSDVFAGRDASEARFKQTDLMQYRLLHFAMHALGNGPQPEKSALVFSMGADSTEDGHLEAKEIYDLRLNADMVVLSACQTGAGHGAPGEGIHGLARAFLFAGARSLVASMWKVEDEPTAALMTGFYEYLREGMSKAESLRRAKLDLIQNGYSHPRQWAGFVLFGEADEPLELPARATAAVATHAYYVYAGLFVLIPLAAVLFRFLSPPVH